MLPGILVGLHYAIQVLRPRLGYGSDIGGRHTPWIIGGMAVLASGGVGAAAATALMATHTAAGVVLALIAFILIGIGVGAAGTSLLVLLAKRVDERRRAAAATIVWVMMIAGFVITAATAGHFLDPFSLARMVMVCAITCGGAFLLTLIAVWGVEGSASAIDSAPPSNADTNAAKPPFREALAQVWAEPQARRFTIFVFVSMLAYSAQDLILEPFAGAIFGLTPGESTQLSGLQHGGVLLGMLLVALAVTAARLGSLRSWTIGGCIASALALSVLALGGLIGSGSTLLLRASVFMLGVTNGAFAVAAIGSMMSLAGHGRQRREGVRMGLWGAAQAIAFGLGGFLGTAAVDLTRYLFGSPVPAYASVFAAQAALFLVAAVLAARVAQTTGPDSQSNPPLRFSAIGESMSSG
jgi:BCD family chlorophyll transporter-like MFS transporter